MPGIILFVWQNLYLQYKLKNNELTKSTTGYENRKKKDLLDKSNRSITGYLICKPYGVLSIKVDIIQPTR